MGVMDVAKSIGGGIGALAGDLPKAVLFMRKYKENMLYTQDELEAYEKGLDQEGIDMMNLFEEQEGVFHDAKSLTNDHIADLMSNALYSQTQSLNAAASALEGNPVSGNGSASFAAMKKIANANGFVAMEVQYNPSTIYIQSAQGEREINDGSLDNMANTQIRQFRSPSVTNLSFQLVFDAMNQMDAFMLDASMMSTGGAMALVKDIYNNWGDSEGFTVRPQVEGLIASLYSPLTRRAIFSWAGMVFAGEMLQVTGKYTMFNKIGNPIRATVDITMQQMMQNADTELASQWNKSFNKVFGEAGAHNIAGAASKWDQAKNNALLNFSI